MFDGLVMLAESLPKILRTGSDDLGNFGASESWVGLGPRLRLRFLQKIYDRRSVVRTQNPLGGSSLDWGSSSYYKAADALNKGYGILLYHPCHVNMSTTAYVYEVLSTRKTYRDHASLRDRRKLHAHAQVKKDLHAHAPLTGASGRDSLLYSALCSAPATVSSRQQGQQGHFVCMYNTYRYFIRDQTTSHINRISG